MYPADSVYFEFEAFCKTHGMEEKDFVNLLKGFNSMPDADRRGPVESRPGGKPGRPARSPSRTTAARRPARALARTTAGREWRQQFDDWLTGVREPDQRGPPRRDATRRGARIRARSSSTIKQLLRAHGRRLGSHPRARPRSSRSASEVDRRASRPGSRRTERPASSSRLLPVAQQVYAFQEDHGFYIDAGLDGRRSTTRWRAAGRRLHRSGLLELPEDVFFLTYNELVEILGDLAREREDRHVPPRGARAVAHRRAEGRTARTSAQSDAPLTVGNVPTTMSDPIALKVFGIVDEVLHPKGEKEVVGAPRGLPGRRRRRGGTGPGDHELRGVPDTPDGRDPRLPVHGHRLDAAVPQDRRRSSPTRAAC